MIISVFTPHGGCPERCHFCDQRVSGGEPVSQSKIEQLIEQHLSTKSFADEIAFYGGTFTQMPRQRQVSYLEVAQSYVRRGKVGSVRIATRPDAIESEWMQELFSKFSVRTVELGVQSFNPNALRALGRTHSNEQVLNAVAVLRELGLRVGLHLMVGLPKENLVAEKEDGLTMQWLRRLKPDLVRIHPLLVLKGTALEAMYRSGAHIPLTLEAAVDRCANLTAKIEQEDILVHRLGLQANELLGESIVAGPYHPAFGELVRSRIWRYALTNALRERGTPDGSAVELEAQERLLSQIKGQKSCNIKWLKTIFNLSTIRVNVVKEPTHDAQQKIERRKNCRNPARPFEIRICDSPRPPKRRQIESPQ